MDQGGISRLAQLNISGGSHGTPMGLQENKLDLSFIGTDLVKGDVGGEQTISERIIWYLEF